MKLEYAHTQQSPPLTDGSDRGNEWDGGKAKMTTSVYGISPSLHVTTRRLRKAKPPKLASSTLVCSTKGIHFCNCNNK
ncbi:hypothetical protein E2542_SST25908 [Spatholobus suberectus]|nr:hypothetical protein E2542_SST25908 [Spatholobus suberectus]